MTNPNLHGARQYDGFAAGSTMALRQAVRWPCGRQHDGLVVVLEKSTNHFMIGLFFLFPSILIL